jgi:hypothetical protein
MARSPTATGLTYRERAWHALELALSELDVEREALVLAMAALRRTVTAPVPAAPKPKRTYHRKPKAAAPGPEVPAAPLVRLPDETTVKQILGLLMNKHRTADVAALLKTDIDGARVVLRALVAQGRVTRGPGGHWHRAEGEQYEQG